MADTIHHWNWPIEENKIDAVNPNNLFPTSHDTHMDVHRRAGGGAHPTKDPIAEQNKLDLEKVTELQVNE